MIFSDHVWFGLLMFAAGAVLGATISNIITRQEQR
jgi:hypothetical protein